MAPAPACSHAHILSSCNSSIPLILSLSPRSSKMRSILLLSLLTQALAFPALWSPSSRPAQAVLSPDQGQEPQGSADAPDIAVGWVDPRVNGGRFLDVSNKCAFQGITCSL